MFTDDGIQACRNVKVRPEGEAWCAAAIKRVDIHPFEYHHYVASRRPMPKPESGEFQGAPAADVPPEGPKARKPPRSTPLQKYDFEMYGYTKACPGCRNLERDLPHGSHSRFCRHRIELELSKTEEGRIRLQRAELKKNQYLEE